MHSSVKRRWMQAMLWLLASSAFFPVTVSAAPIAHVDVSIADDTRDIPDTVKSRIASSIRVIGEKVLVGKEENIFSLNSTEYNKVMADIINRVVVGYIVSDLDVRYGETTSLTVRLQPVGDMIRRVETEVDYGNLSPAAKALVEKDVASLPELMENLLVGLPIDSVGWAESVTQSAGRDLLARLLPEFSPSFEVKPGVTSEIRISLSPQGTIVRKGELNFRRTTVPRLLLLRAAMETEEAMSELEGLPVGFVMRHQDDIAEHMGHILREDSLIRRYQIDVRTALSPGEVTRLDVDALTDHWLIKTEAWLDAGREGNRNTALRGMLGHFVGGNNVVFGEARVYPGPMSLEVYGGFFHKFGDVLNAGYKYNFNDNSGHIFGEIPFGQRVTLRYDRDFHLKQNEFGLSYKIHNYMTVEYVYNDEDGKWIRLIANL